MKQLLLTVAMLPIAYAQAQSGMPQLKAETRYTYYGSVSERADTTSYIYNGGGNASRYVDGIAAWNYDTCYTYDVTSGSMSTINQTAHKLDLQGNILERTFINYSTPDNYERHYYTYDASNRIASWRVSYWNNIAQQQEDYSRTSYTYDATGALTEEIFETYGGGGWAVNLRTRYIYTGGNNTQRITESWNPIDQTWHHVDEVKQSFDASGRKLSMEWVNVTREFYTYDANGNLKTCAVEGKQGSFYKKSHLLEYTYNDVAGVKVVVSVARKKWNAPANNYEFQNGDDSVHYYYDVSYTSAPHVAARDINLHIYPQPARDVIYLSAHIPLQQQYTITLHDATGKILKLQKGPSGGSVKLHVEDVPPGNYILQLRAGNDVASRQVAIAR
jgi:hypothetical protein